MKIFAFRLKPDEDLKQSLKNFTLQENIKAGFILTAIGSLKVATIRFANQDTSTVLSDKFEILSLNGTIATTGVHLHIAISDKQGKTIGGHLDDGCIIYTTAEIVIGISEEYTFLRTPDQQTGYKELEIIPNLSLSPS
ncbi:UDP-N-acetylglucosamine pyrophosphorylase [Scytonema sp. HK-05]|uniref:PPC domain-containing DNA-binding protein n=1 Tax=Scytonema sp. HK-05 TaxID=1137095 RepID=UPI000937144E|nr:PPC domain-containing DNA-binding protein [Scytonema sp. HK-05]OKH58848.1 DNA-binding protein with PD1-like DNA-binding motif [Scytonema sp. HK-05]BAY48156.1 UDP-N-acetylglucosamine pyrophosphorylase [Scytonema sp. HK-05]